MTPDELPQPLQIPPFPFGVGTPALNVIAPASLVAPNQTSASSRQSLPVEGKRPRAPWNDAFRLGFGDGGAKITQGWLEWEVTTLRFEKKFIRDAGGELLDDVNSLESQEPIDGVKVMDIDGAEVFTDLNEWMQLTWFGDVYAVVILDEATGKPTSVSIEGPDAPNMRPIARLDSDLSRGSSGGSGGSGSGEERVGFYVKIGNVTEGRKIEQDHVGNLYWFLAFVPENQSSSSGSSGSSGGSSTTGGSASAGSSTGSSKDTAIHPAPDGGYRKWYAMEATEVLFFDFQEFTLSQGRHRIEIDPIVVFSCEPDSLRAFASPNVGTCHATVKAEFLRLNVRVAKAKKQCVNVMLKGVRRGFASVRLGYANFDDFVDNECRLNPRMTRDEVIAALAKKGVTQ